MRFKKGDVSGRSGRRVADRYGRVARSTHFENMPEKHAGEPPALHGCNPRNDAGNDEVLAARRAHSLQLALLEPNMRVRGFCSTSIFLAGKVG
jgi:hypothetical protein